jgi:YegS/Rv2252/BmrU family lipid kinase
VSRKLKIAFIINPVSGVGKQKKVEIAIENYLDTSRFSAHIVYSQYAGFITDYITQNINKFDGFVAVGGDGTVNEAVKALVNTDKFLSIIPTGSGNGLARHLKIPMNIEKAIQKLNFATINPIDVLKVADFYSANVAGCGFDAEVGWAFSTLKKRGLSSYIRLISEKIWRYNPIDFHLKVNDYELNGKAFILSIANGSQYGNNAFVSPNADLNDGVFELVIVKPFPKRYYLTIVTRLFSKQLHRSKFVTTVRAKSALLKVNTNKIHIDGEPESIEPNKFFKVEILPGSLKFLF